MDKYEYIIIGGGIAAGHAAEVFANSENYTKGDLAIFSADSALPYDRTSLSKDFLKGNSSQRDIQKNDREYYNNHGIDVYLDTTITRIDPTARIIYADDGMAYSYQELLIATGSSPNTFNSDDAKLDGIHYLRYLEQSEDIRAQMAEANDIVIVGGGYIGMEVAAIAAEEADSVTMIYPQSRMMAHRFFTPEMSDYFEGIYADNDVTLISEARVTGFEGDSGHVTAVRTEDGKTIKADLVIAGLGATPNIGLIEPLGIDIADDGAIAVDSKLRTSINNISAVGDVANYPDIRLNKRLRVPHWHTAVQQGEYWAERVLGETDEWFSMIPYFFSDFFDISYEFWGDPEDADEIVHRSDLDDGSFSVWWLKDKKVQAAFLLDRPDASRDWAQKIIRTQDTVDAKDLKNSVKELDTIS